MNTPIVDFLKKYDGKDALRLHMPGHKGKGILGVEGIDLTEVFGADSLYEASGIISQSQDNASVLFGAETYYSTEGSSLSIRAMIYLVTLIARERGEEPYILAGRNAHKTFLSAVGLLDVKLGWLYSECDSGYLSAVISANEIEKQILIRKPTAIYITSPDYLGNIADIESIARVCKRHGVLLLVDNAHGAYLKFLPKSLFPIDLGADMCCSSAHKTLPVITGGAYLHISSTLLEKYSLDPSGALALFGSTSPSYLIMASLDNANGLLANGYGEEIAKYSKKVEDLKKNLVSYGYTPIGNEPLKITLFTKPYGYYGNDFSDELRKMGIECEFADPDFVVMMLTPSLGENALKRIEKSLKAIPKAKEIYCKPPKAVKSTAVMSVKEAILSPYETVSTEDCCGRVLAQANLSCPPAVPIVSCGEVIDENAITAMKYYGITKCRVVKK